ncbi:MAG: hypothetical protein RLN63_05045 [Miltoncostaeaceae bacterium]
MAALVLGTGVVAGCGGDDEETTATTVTEQVTVTEGDPAESVPTESIPDVIPGGVPESDDGSGDGGTSGAAPTDEEIDQAVQAYMQILGLSEDQARCMIEGSLELSENIDPDNPAAILGSGAFELFERCDINPADLASQFGGTP